VTGDSIETPAPDPVKKPRKPRASDAASDEPKATAAEQDTQQDPDVDPPQADDDDGGTDDPAAATTKDEPPHVEKHKTEPHATAEPAKQSGTGSDKVPKSRSGAGLMRFRRKIRK